MGCPQVLCFELLLVLVVFLELSVLVCPVLAYFLQNVLVCLVLARVLVCVRVLVLVRVHVVCFAQTALVVCFSQIVLVAAFLLGSIHMAALKKYIMLKIMLFIFSLPYLVCHSSVGTEVLLEVFHTRGLEGGHLGR